MFEIQAKNKCIVRRIWNVLGTCVSRKVKLAIHLQCPRSTINLDVFYLRKIKIREIVYHLWKMYHYYSLHPSQEDNQEGSKLTICNKQKSGVTWRTGGRYWREIDEQIGIEHIFILFNDQVLALVVAETQWYALQHNNEALQLHSTLSCQTLYWHINSIKLQQSFPNWNVLLYQSYLSIGNC